MSSDRIDPRLERDIPREHALTMPSTALPKIAEPVALDPISPLPKSFASPMKVLGASLAPPVSSSPSLNDVDGNESDSSDDSVLSYEDDEEDSQAKKDQRETERQRVLEAAGLRIKKERPSVPVRRPTKTKREPPPAPMRRTRSSTLSAVTDSSRSSPPIKPSRAAPMPDAYDRYEAYLEKAKTAPELTRGRSQSDVRPSSMLSNGSGGAISTNGLQSPSQSSFNVLPIPQPKESRLAGFMSKVTGQTATDKRVIPLISGPVISGPAVDHDEPQEEGFGLTWGSLVDPSLLENLSARDRKRQEVNQNILNLCT